MFQKRRRARVLGAEDKKAFRYENDRDGWKLACKEIESRAEIKEARLENQQYHLFLMIYISESYSYIFARL